MINPTQEDTEMSNNYIKDFINNISNEKKLLQEDLKALELPLQVGNVSDFGCDCGLTTYCLTSIVNATKTIGIDNNPTSINRAMHWYEAVKWHIQLTNKETLSDDIMSQKANLLLGISRPPEFIVGDVISGENIPSEISLAYCRRLLVNIAHGKYEDNLSGVERARLAIKNMARKIISGGWFIALEESSGGNFSQLLEEEGLQRINVAPFQVNSIVQYTRYVYRKLD